MPLERASCARLEGWPRTSALEALMVRDAQDALTMRLTSIATVSMGLDQRATAFVERTAGFVAGHGGEQLVEIPLAFRLLGLLHLEQVHVVSHASVVSDAAVPGEEVVDRGFPHLRHHLRRFVGADRIDGLEVVHGG